ncbi:MAG TPA: TIM-barrel domain-containing protein [Solirubrobacteraceae bacterium]|jgi:alpha-glucosidase (family GH31 glycosyl hydrolase)|nr:TIM-barrel domain-containing protein [Solirubrobacteraceae bacterium]
MRQRLLVATAVWIVAAVGVMVSAPAGQAATTASTPVNLTTPIDVGAARASSAATVMAGDARFQVLGAGLIRMEYAPSGQFEDAPTVNALYRRFAVPSFHVERSGGWLTITTSAATLRYRLGSGPFTPANTSLTLRHNGRSQTVTPQWQNECPFDQVCDAGAATLGSGATIATDHSGYDSIAGFIAGFGQGNQASADWKVLGAPAGQATVTVRYANYIGALGGPAPRTIDLTVNGTDVQTLTLPATSSWDAWSTVTAKVTLSAGDNTIGLLCAAADSCNVNADTLSVSPAGAAAPTQPNPQYLGGYTRGFDTATYGPRYNCPAGTPTAAQCAAALPQMHPGILDRTGYRLLDDTQSAVWTSDGWAAARAPGGDVQDGYLFVYGHDYGQALHNLDRLTGPSPLLPQSTFGVWYSDYHAYSTSDYENTLIPAFRANHVPLDTLSVDTNWKSPNAWDGWEWNTSLFPDPQGFLSWAKQQGINVTLNIHTSIADDDPQLPATESVAGNSLSDSTCFIGACKVWDWSSIPQAESYFALHQPYESQGVAFWWLDWCCDASTASLAGVTPDSWINHLYAADLANKGQRGFVLSRIGSSFQNPDEVYPAGPWSGHTSTLAFTGDTWGTWNTLAFQAQLSADEASIDQTYVSDDIGSFLGPPPGAPSDTPDLYARWVQLGAFQPVLRLHSSDGNRLPWQYPEPANTIAADFLRLREALVPYSYTLAAEAVNSGMPMTHPLYLDYPGRSQAYSNPGEYLYGPDVLVAPVTTPGTVGTETVWFPPGQWTDWFTGATFTGPSTQTLTVPLDRMPVFVKAGGIVPEQAAMSHVGADPGAPTTLRVYPGAPGRFMLYQDAGSGNGYLHGQDSHTPITTSTTGSRTSVTIGPALGRYPGEPATRRFSVEIQRVTAPHQVFVDGRRVTSSYDVADHTLTVPVDNLALTGSAVITEVGGSPVVSSEPAAVDLSINPSTPLSLPAGGSTTVTTAEHDNGPGGATGISVSLTAPSGWTVKPASPVSGGNLASGASSTQSWTVTAPSGASSPVDGTLVAHATYDSAGRQEQVTTSQQGAPAPAPLPPPVITGANPSTADPGASVTLTGQNFGASQGSSYLTLAQGGTSWGAPYDGAKLTITSWSDTSITFELPASSGVPFPISPGSASVTVSVSGQTSPAQTLTINGATGPPPAISSVNPSSTTGGSTVTLSGQNFGASQGTSYLTLAQDGTSWGAPFDGAKLTITSWSDTSVTFQLPPSSGSSFPIAPGSATVTVTVGGQTSNSETITVTS